ncbi:MAG: hypothetical protein U0946_00110 [Patescibacteria group bacterium]|nr:hypothetical protein [Patescibacteria group bacterium]
MGKTESDNVPVNLETERKYQSQVARILTYSLRWPQEETSENRLVWYVGIKSDKSAQAGQVDIFGGRKKQTGEIYEPS